MNYLAIVGVLLFAWTLFQCISCLLVTNRSNKKKLPPGPIPLPLIGNLHNILGSQPHQSLAKLADKFGPIISLKLGQITTVVISSSAMAKEIIQKQDLAFSSRTIPDAIHAINQYQFSVIWLPVDTRWRSLRKIMNTYIFSGNRLDANQHLRSQKIQDLIAYCHKCSQTRDAVNIGQAAFETSMNILSSVIFSKDVVDHYANLGKEFKDLVCKISEAAGKPNLADYYPVLKRIDPQGIRRRLSKHLNIMLEQIERLIDERLEQRRKSSTRNGKDVLDILLNLSQEDPQAIDRNHIERLCLGPVQYNILEIDALVYELPAYYAGIPTRGKFQHNILKIGAPVNEISAYYIGPDLFIAGTDTTSNTLEWAMVEIMRKPYIMEKAKAELAQVIGKGKIIEEADVARLPYLHCIVKETLRIHPTVPLLIRKVDQNVETCGYFIPKGSQVIVHVWSMCRDPTIWEEPLVFKPERFWGSKMDVRGQDFELIPFGAGRRICPGLPLAIRTLSVMLGSLLNSFDWKVEGDIAPEDLDVEEKFGLSLAKSIPLRLVPIPL